MPNITQKQISDNYLAYLQGQNSNINASAPLSYWSIIAGAEGSVFLDLYANLDIVSKSIYIQNLQGSQIDNTLYESGLTPRGALTVSVISVTFTTDTVTAGTTVTIPANTQFQSTNGIIYTLFQDTPYIQQPPISPIPTPPTPPNWTPTYTPTPITLYAIVGGSTTFVGVDSTLTATITILGVTTALTAIVYTSIAGQNQESDQSCINRLLLQKRSPNSGGRIGDYFRYAKEASTAVTDIITVSGYKVISGIKSLGIFPLIGSFITENQLNAGLGSIVYPPPPPPTPVPPQPAFTQYSRQIDGNTLSTVQTYILSLDLLGLDVLVNPCVTYTVDISGITVFITLPDIYNNVQNPLNTLLQIQSLDVSNNVITISISIGDLIKREFRRVICNQPYGGTKLRNVDYNVITINDIIDGLNYQLSYNNGQITKLLVDIQIVGANILVPAPQFGTAINPFGTFAGIYDIFNYDAIDIEIVI